MPKRRSLFQANRLLLDITVLDLHTKQKVHATFSKQLSDINAVTGISSLLLAVCFIDALAGFHSGHTAKQNTPVGTRYKAFAAKYLPEYANELYEIRNNLVHSFSNLMGKLMFVDDSGFTTAFHQLQYFLDLKVFDIALFKSTLQLAFNCYFNDLEQPENEQLRANFLKRYADLGLPLLEDSVFPALRNMKGEITVNIAYSASTGCFE